MLNVTVCIIIVNNNTAYTKNPANQCYRYW